jgi:Tat protein secretion system quality control protein TatD with DNase activity
MAYVDRGGGREAKGHDRRSKRGILAKANPFAQENRPAIPDLPFSPTAPGLRAGWTPTSLIDAGVNLMSRQLARDQARVFQRAADDGVAAVLAYTTDFDKVAELVAVVKEYPGLLYAVLGLHPDNVKRGSNDKLLAGRLQELKALALTPECIAIYCGLDLSRDIGSHFSQEKLLDGQMTIAAEARLPCILVDIAATERLSDKIVEFRADFAAGGGASSSAGSSSAAGSSGGAGGLTPVADAAAATVPATSLTPWIPRCAVLAFDGDERALLAYIRAGASIILSGLVCEPSDAGEQLRSLVPLIPLERLLFASNSPMHTPQNIPGELF